MAKHHPEATPELLAYMLSIMRAQREFREPAWRLYDEAYCEKAAATGNRKWSQIDPLLYNQIFTGKAKEMALCQHCQSPAHASDGCKLGPPRKKVAIAGEVSQPRGGESQRPNSASPVCWQFNQGRCSFHPNCRFRHVCLACKLPHAFINCPRVPWDRPAYGSPPAGQRGDKAKHVRTSA